VSDKLATAEYARHGHVIVFPARPAVGGTPWEPWVDERAIARHFNACERTIRRWRALGMPSRLFGGLRRYRVSECEAWHGRTDVA
jgi:hypothetical protein